jgi:hypothetical protein
MSFITDAVGALFGTKQQADASNLAARQQADSQAQGYAQLQQNLNPYANFGASAMPNLMQKLGLGGQGGGFQFNPQDYANTPAYQFILGQGLKNTNNALSSQGLLGSGAQAKAISDYTTGLANTTYSDQFKNALAGFQGNVNPLISLLTLGQNAAAGVGTGGYNSAVNAGNAIAQGTIGSGAQSANTLNGLMGLGNLANTAGATFSPTGGYQSGLSNIYSGLFGGSNPINSYGGGGLGASLGRGFSPIGAIGSLL